MKANEKKAYSRPGLVEYGRMTELTRGLFGSAPDCIGWLNTDSGPRGICESRSS
jgi:hypothetical protein